MGSVATLLHCYITLRGSVATHQLRVAHTLGKTSMLECSRGDEDDSDDLLVIMTLLGSEEKPISNMFWCQFKITQPISL